MAKATKVKDRKTARLPKRRAGLVRFRELLDATESLLAEMSIQDVGLYQIAERAGAPIASVYHFFPNKEAALLALAAEHHEILQRIAREQLQPPPQTWQELVRRKIVQSTTHYNEHPAALRLFLGAGVTVELRTADAMQTLRLGEIRANLLDHYFDMPPVRDWVRKLATSIAIVDGICILSYSQCGHLTPEFVEDAHSASVAYLRTFLPEHIERRQTPKAFEPAV
ncbi:TetR/AcrR family transcriptional regulator [Mesorhizobium sp. ORM6]